VSLRDTHSLIIVAGSIRKRYIIEPVGGIRSSRLALNGVPVEEDLVFAWGKESTRRKYKVAVGPGKPGDGLDSAPSEVVLPPYACAFVLQVSKLVAIRCKDCPRTKHTQTKRREKLHFK
jgi:hypothetical protein